MSDTEIPQTAPDSISVSVRGLDEEGAQKLSNFVCAYIRELSRYIDLETLDGVTLASDYDQALLDLDRGYATSYKLTPTKGEAVGVAMTPSVLRDGNLKSHIVLNLGLAQLLEDTENGAFPMALHTLAHECAHVEITAKFDKAFPGTLLRSRRRDIHDDYRWQIILACWDEYCATWISANYGGDPTPGYVETFTAQLRGAREKANSAIRFYRLHGDHDKVLGEVYGAYGDLMKFACYLIGTMVGRGLSLDALPEVVASLDGHWFAPYFGKIQEICADIRSEYGAWTDASKFERLGDLADQIVREGGLFVKIDKDGRVGFDVPFTSETMPF